MSALPAHPIGDAEEEIWECEVEDPAQLRKMERAHTGWVYRALDMLPEEDQDLICKRFGLPGHEETSAVSLGSDPSSRALRRFRLAVEAYHKGEKPRFHFKRGRPSNKQDVSL
jgi:hypothetical protein